MDESRRVKISRYLSKHLRHHPERLGITLESGGWVPVAALLEACRAHRFALTVEELEHVVRECPKQRYAFDADRRRIRASYGHSVAVDLGLETAAPPALLYHGTTWSRVGAILAEGLRPMGRVQVHLSGDVETALRVGRRHGPPVLLEIDTSALQAAGAEVYHAGGMVWLTEYVPPECLRLHESGDRNGEC